MLIGKMLYQFQRLDFLGEYQIKKIDLNLLMAFRIQFLKKIIFIMDLHLSTKKFLYLIKNENDYQYGFGLVHEAMWAGSTYLLWKISKLI